MWSANPCDLSIPMNLIAIGKLLQHTSKMLLLDIKKLVTKIIQNSTKIQSQTGTSIHAPQILEGNVKTCIQNISSPPFRPLYSALLYNIMAGLMKRQARKVAFITKLFSINFHSWEKSYNDCVGACDVATREGSFESLERLVYKQSAQRVQNFWICPDFWTILNQHWKCPEIVQKIWTLLSWHCVWTKTNC